MQMTCSVSFKLSRNTFTAGSSETRMSHEKFDWDTFHETVYFQRELRFRIKNFVLFQILSSLQAITESILDTLVGTNSNIGSR